MVLLMDLFGMNSSRGRFPLICRTFSPFGAVSAPRSNSFKPLHPLPWSAGGPQVSVEQEDSCRSHIDRVKRVCTGSNPFSFIHIHFHLMFACLFVCFNITSNGTVLVDVNYSGEIFALSN